MNTLSDGAARKALIATLFALLALPEISEATVQLVTLPDEGGLPTVGLELDKQYLVSAIQVDLSGVPETDVLASIPVEHPEAYSPFFNPAPAHVNLLSPDFGDLDYTPGVLVKWHFTQGTDVGALSFSVVGYNAAFDPLAGKPPPLDQSSAIPEPSSRLILASGLLVLTCAAGMRAWAREKVAFKLPLAIE